MPYSIRVNVEQIFGAENVKKWADADNDFDTVKIAARIDANILKSDDQINSRLRNGPYKIPFITPFDGLVVDVSARLAGVLTYELRGITDNDPSNHDLLWHRDQVEKTLRGLMSGRLRLDATLAGITEYVRTPLMGS